MADMDEWKETLAKLGVSAEVEYSGLRVEHSLYTSDQLKCEPCSKDGCDILVMISGKSMHKVQHAVQHVAN